MDKNTQIESLKALLYKSDFSNEQKQEIMDMIKELSKEENNDTSKENSLKTKTNDIVNKNELTNTQSINRTIIEKYEIDQNKISDKIPCNMDLLKIYFIAYKNRLLNKNSNILGAYILKWINEGFISYAFKKGNLFKKSQYVIKLSSKIEFENDYEKEFYSFVKHAAFDNELTYKEFKCYTERKHFHLKNLLDEIFEKQEKQLIELGHLDKNTNTKTQVKNNSFNENDQITVTTVETSFKYNEDLIKDINDIIAFKNYIKSLNLKQDIKLSKEQLIVCELLGITNYIQSYFSTVYPEFYFRYYQYLFEIRSSSIRPETGLQKFIKLSKMEMK